MSGYLRRGPTREVPTGPVRDAVDAWLARAHARMPDGPQRGTPELSPEGVLTNRMRPKQPGSAARKLWGLHHEQFERLSLRIADELVCATVGPDGWHADPELAAVYEALPAGVDDGLLSEGEIADWARETWEGWRPVERAMFAGALESLLEKIRGAGDGDPAKHRARGAHQTERGRP